MIGRKLQGMVALLVAAILGMGFYVVHLRHKAESLGTPPVVQPLAPPSSGPQQQMTLYVANDEDDSLHPVTVSAALPSDEGERGRLALEKLIARYQLPGSTHPLGAGAAVEDVFVLDAVSVVVNLNADFAATHRSGIEPEELTIESMILTLKAQIPELTRVRFLVDGKSVDTLAGHIDIGGWLKVGLVADAASRQIPGRSSMESQ